MSDVCIVGAGVCGLTAAYALEKAGLSVCLLDASQHVGGVIRSERREDHLLEYAANTALAKPALVSLICELDLKKKIRLPSPQARHKYFATPSANGDARLLRAPLDPFHFLTTSLLSLRSKARCLGEPWCRTSGKDDETVEEFFTRRFGAELCERIVAPALNGIWAARLDRLSMRSALPTVWSAEQQHGSVLSGFFKRGRRPSSPTSKAPLTFSDGMSTLPIRISDKLTRTTRITGAFARSLRPSSQDVTVEYEQAGVRKTLCAGAVIHSADSLSAAECFSGEHASIAELIRAVPYAPVGVLHLSIESSHVRHPLDGFGFLVPPCLGLTLLGTIFSSSLFPDRAPKGRALLTCFVGGMARPDAADVRDPSIQAQAVSELDRLLGLKHRPDVLDASFYPRAIPNFPLGHYLLEDSISTLHGRSPRLRLAGSWLRNLSVPQRIDEGLAAAADVARLFEHRAQMPESRLG